MTDTTTPAPAAPKGNGWLSRKFLLAAATLIAAAAGRALGLLDAPAAVDLAKWTLGLYFTGNVGTLLAAGLSLGKGGQ